MASTMRLREARRVSPQSQREPGPAAILVLDVQSIERED
jgi:hypothetical protein